MPHLQLQNLVQVIKSDPAFIEDSETNPSHAKNNGYGIYPVDDNVFVVKQTTPVGSGKDSNIHSPPSYKTFKRFYLRIDSDTLNIKLITQTNEDLSLDQLNKILDEKTLAAIRAIQNPEESKLEKSTETSSYIPRGFGGCSH